MKAKQIVRINIKGNVYAVYEFYNQYGRPNFYEVYQILPGKRKRIFCDDFDYLEEATMYALKSAIADATST